MKSRLIGALGILLFLTLACTSVDNSDNETPILTQSGALTISVQAVCEQFDIIYYRQSVLNLFPQDAELNLVELFRAMEDVLEMARASKDPGIEQVAREWFESMDESGLVVSNTLIGVEFAKECEIRRLGKFDGVPTPDANNVIVVENAATREAILAPLTPRPKATPFVNPIPILNAPRPKATPFIRPTSPFPGANRVSRFDSGRPWSGEEWPYTIDQGWVGCKGVSKIFVSDSGRGYGLNGFAIQSGYTSSFEIRRRYSDGGYFSDVDLAWLGGPGCLK